MQRVLAITIVVWIFGLINFYLYNAFRAKEAITSVISNCFIGTILFCFVIMPLVYIVAQFKIRKKYVINTCLVAIVSLMIIGGIGYLSIEQSKMVKDNPLFVPMLIYFLGLGWIISATSILLIQQNTIQYRYIASSSTWLGKYFRKKKAN